MIQVFHKSVVRDTKITWAMSQPASLSSRGYQFAGVDFDDPNFQTRAYERRIAQGQSKTANALFAVNLDAIGKPHGVGAFSVHPGDVITDLTRYMLADEIRASGFIDEQGRPISDPARKMKTAEQGAATSIWCATSQQLDGRGGVSCENCDIAIAVPADSTEQLGVRPGAINPELAERLCSLSESLTSVAALK